MIEILKALLVGVIAGIPVGPILVMVTQRTLCHGRKAGVMVGLGAATGDMLFAAVALPPDRKDLSGWTCYLQALGSTLSNPAALALILALLATLQVDGGALGVPDVVLAPVVGAGEWLYWLLVVYLLARFLHLSTRSLRILSRIAGALVCVFALVLVVRGLVMIIK